MSMAPSGRETPGHYEDRARILQAMAHPSRLLLVDELSHGERCVQELTAVVGHDMSTVSKHLGILRKAGVLQADRRGKRVYYRLKVPCVLHFFHCLESVLKASGQE